MLQTVRLLLLVSFISTYLLIFNAAQSNSNAFSNNISYCLFDRWKIGTKLVLAGKVQCNGHERTGLCYGFNGQALFAVCYNKKSLIPEFTGHVIDWVSGGATGRNGWRSETGKYAPNRQSDWKKDYRSYSQRNIIPNIDHRKQHFYSRGHLTPNGDFTTAEERALTMVNTNIAPQWQLFNGQNWATLERAVRSYSIANNRSVYVFTGTGGISRRLKNGQQMPVLLNKRVLVPKYFWKAICDPVTRSSVVFVAQNLTGEQDKQKKGGCIGIQQTVGKGVVYCYSLGGLKGRKEAQSFKLPHFANICSPSQRGTFLDQYLNGLK